MTFSVVIPAHNEATVIAKCLAFVPDLEPGEAEVVVVANGCTDSTAAAAAAVPGVTVVNLAEGGKRGALNAGDAATTAFPRIYLDADVVIGAGDLRQLVAALSAGLPRVAAPRVHFAIEGRPWTVRAFYTVYERLPYVREGLIGLGVYAVSPEGRARFGEFPAVTADDLFVQRLYAPSERIILTGSTFSVEVPRTLGALIAVRTRTAFGSRELAQTGDDAFATSTKQTLIGLARLAARSPQLIPSVAVYLAVTVAARGRARRAAGRAWHRDTTTR